jgi:hypothetical protein
MCVIFFKYSKILQWKKAAPNLAITIFSFLLIILTFNINLSLKKQYNDFFAMKLNYINRSSNNKEY